VSGRSDGCEVVFVIIVIQRILIVLTRIRQAVIKRYFSSAFRAFLFESGELAEGHVDICSSLGGVLATEEAGLAGKCVLLVRRVADLFLALLTSYVE